MTIEEIQELIKAHPNTLSKSLKSKDALLFEKIHNEYNCKKFSEKVYLYIGNEIGRCLECNNITNFVSISHGYSKYCSQICKRKSKLVVEKMKATCNEKYGVDNFSKTEEFKNLGFKFNQEKCLETKILRYGTSSYNNREKCANTKLQRYGNSKYCNREKIIATNQSKYGVNSYTCTAEGKQVLSSKIKPQMKSILEKQHKTLIERYNVDNPSLVPGSRLKAQQTCFKNYGVEHHMQDAKIFSGSMFKRKDYTFPSGKTIKVQGYEPKALDILLNEGYLEDDIVTDCTLMPEFYYFHNGRNRRYYPDIYIPKENKFIEVKSDYTSKVDPDIIELKCDSVRESGYEIELWILNS